MKLAATFTAAAALLAIAATAQVNDAPLIISGTAVPSGTKTYTTDLHDTTGGEDFCGGSPIAPKYVLTAAHCTGIAYAVAGTHYVSGSADGEHHKVVKEIIHPDNNSTTMLNDFPILELATASKITPVALSAADGSDYVVGTNLTAMGWGATSEDGAQSRELLSVAVPIVSNAVYAPAVVKTGIMDKTMLCADGVTNKDSCQGDSGSSLINSSNMRALVGHIRMSEGCIEANKSDVHRVVFRDSSSGCNVLYF